MDAGGTRWNHDLLERLFSDEEKHVILSIPISHTNQEDRLIWRGTEKGTFSVKIAYHILKDWELAQTAGGPSRQEKSPVWKELWKLKIPNVEKVFFWRACHNILPTRENLVKRKVITDSSCPVCENEMETTSHILWH